MLRPSLLAITAAAFALVGGSATAQVPPMAQTQSAVTTSDEQAIHAVIDAFKAALVAKDKAAMAGLFYEGKVVWRASAHPASREAAARMTGQPVPVVQEEGAYELLDDPRIATLALEERFYDPKIVTDGQIATLTFGYDFRAQGQIQNWGTESWQMVKTETGWKILHLLFSVNLQLLVPAPEPR